MRKKRSYRASPRRVGVSFRTRASGHHSAFCSSSLIKNAAASTILHGSQPSPQRPARFLARHVSRARSCPRRLAGRWKPDDDLCAAQLKGKPPPANLKFPALAAAIFELEIGRTSASCVVSYNAIYLPHVAPGQSSGQPMLAITLGEHTGGELVVEGTVHQTQYSPVVYDGWSELSWTRPFTGERFGLQFFTHTSARDRLADVAERVIAAQRPFRYRTASTDVNVICEVLGERSAYAGPPSGEDYRWPDVDFSPRGCTVLDIGAHIGAFSRYCLREGANAVIAFEPEPSNLELLQSTSRRHSRRA